jgi:peptide/nickel transport system substrate-binding protein
MSIKALARTTWILIIIVILAVGLGGAVLYYSGVLTPRPVLPEPDFVKDNKMVYESGAAFQWMDPHVSYYQYDYWILWQSVETLLWYNKDSATEIVPWLAESYTRDSPTQYTFHLRQGIKFQDGTPFNATAVWFSLNRLLMLDATSGDPEEPVHGCQAGWILQQLLDTSMFSAFGAEPAYDEAWVQDVLDLNFVEIVNDYTVKINLMTPTTQFEAIMAGPWVGVVSPTETIQKDWEHGGWAGTWDGDYMTYFVNRAGDGDTYFNIPENGWKFGTGAYYVESVDPVTYRIVLKAFNDYWGGPNKMNLPPDGKKRIETIEYLWVESFETRLLDLKAGKASGIGVPEANIFNVVDRDSWLNEAKLVSIVDGVTVHGVFPTLNCWWLGFCSNVTNEDGSFRKWQPFADWRLRMAAACSVNMTYANINVNYRLSRLGYNIIPPGTYPDGAYNPNVKPIFSYDLAKAEELIKDAYENPLTSTTHHMYYYNGSLIPVGVVDNSFSTTNPKTISLYVQTGAETFIKILTTMTDNLNTISRDAYGLTWEVVPVPGGQQYTLASRHRIDAYMGGWIADYNHVLNWLGPHYVSTNTYFSWQRWNFTILDDLYQQAVDADAAGDITELLRINDEMNTIANEALPYMIWWHDTDYFTRSSWLKGWYLNPVYDVDLWSNMYYEQP